MLRFAPGRPAARQFANSHHEGQLMSSCIVQSSGSPALDQESLAMPVRAQPMLQPPQNP
jgi:hypothetical protein